MQLHEILLNFPGKYSKRKILEIDLFDFTSFLAWTFLNFLARCVSTYTYLSDSSLGLSLSRAMSGFLKAALLQHWSKLLYKDLMAPQ